MTGMTGSDRAAGLTGMALAAGLGTRMRPVTNDRPKPLVEVGGMTLIDHALARLAACGVTRAVVNVHHFADMVEAHLKTRTRAPETVISDERAQLLETGGGLVHARALLGDAPILVTNIDAIFLPDRPLDFAGLFQGFDPECEDCRLILVEKSRASGLEGAGDFAIGPETRLNRRGTAAEAPYFYTGMQILNPAILDGWPDEPFSLNRIWDRSLQNGRLTGAVFEGDWLHVGDPQALEETRARLNTPPALGAGAGRDR